MISTTKDSLSPTSTRNSDSEESPIETSDNFAGPSRLIEFEELFKNRYTMDDPSYAKIVEKGIPPVFSVFPFERMNYVDGRDRRGNWRGGRGGNFRGRGARATWQGGRRGRDSGYELNRRQDRDGREREPQDRQSDQSQRY